MRKVAFFAVAGVAGAVSVAACAPTVGEAEIASVVPASASLCRTGEQALFQCQAGAKTIALCAGGVGGERYVQYRFGTPGNVELAYPARGMAGLARANIPFSGGGETQVNFSNGDFQYSVFSRMIRTGFDERGNRPQFSAGVSIFRGGQQLTDHGCTAPVDANFDPATYDLLPEGPPIEVD